MEDVASDFRKKVCEQVRLAAEGLGRYRVLTPFMLEDGDHLVIVLRQENRGWSLSDEGHTCMHLTYALDEKDLMEGTRQRVIANTLSVFGVHDREGELVLPIPDGRFGDALYSFVQALLRISDVTFLSRERVRSTFLEDFHALAESAIPEERRVFDWHHPEHDPEGKYLVDCRVNGARVPLFMYALPNDDKTRDATIALLQFERWSLEFRSVGIFENQEEINRKVLARFTDVCEKQFSSLAARDRITEYVRRPAE
jgi:hypothetical protein